MITVGAYEAKTRLSEFLAMVARGEVVTITKHDRPVALLTPVTPASNVTEVLAAMAELRRSLGPHPVEVREWIDAGRRQ